MGHYLNPGNEAFRRALRSKIYIDKTGMIRYLNSVIGTDDGFVCVSRPRRFGKSMAANMLAAYYGRTCDSREIFAGKNISRSESCEEHRNQYDVIFLNIQHILGAAGSPEAVVTFLQKAVLEELQEEYPDLVEENETHLSTALADIYVQNPEGKRGFVFIIDEWDCMFREAKNDTSSQKQYLDFLKDLFKDRTYIALAYMTGILPIKKYGTHSALNIFDEYSMTDPDIFAEYAGFTEEETRKLCKEYERDFDEIKKWYDGYLFPGGLHIYNPKSVVDAMKSRRLKSFWTSTETYEALQLYIDLNEDGLKEALTEILIGQSCKVDTGSFQNDMMSLKSRDDVLTLLVHLGYLAYDESSRSVYIPNEEVRGEFIRAVRNGGRPDLFRLLQASDELMEATLRMDEETVAQRIQGQNKLRRDHMARTAAIGLQDFEKIRKNNCFYVDKTKFIKEWWENRDDVTLIARPRRFGKTLTMSMTEQFFSIQYAGRGDLFEGLAIWEEEAYRNLQGTYPVISLSFANVKENRYEKVRYRICQILMNVYLQNRFLLEGNVLADQEKAYFNRICETMSEEDATMSLHYLSQFLSRYYHKKVIILLDEYDTPMQEAYVNGYWEELVSFTRSLFNSTFKTNPHLERAIMTGITRVSRESIFSDLNNLEVVTTTSEKYADSFGFTEKEVFAALDEFGMSDREREVKEWYDGFTFGNLEDIYNPWSVLNYLDKKKAGAYWANSSSNSLAGKLIREGSADIKKEFEALLCGQSIITPIDEQIVYGELDGNEEGIWSLLLASGYLKVLHYEEDWESEDLPDYELTLTNREVRRMFRLMVRGWFKKSRREYNEFVKALLADDLKVMNYYMNKVALYTFSSFDTGNKPSEASEPERFYHGFVLGLLVELSDRYTVTSNRESGFGRYDVLLEPKQGDDGMILEFKVQDAETEKELSDTVNAALQQIEEKKYDSILRSKGVPEEKIRKYGFAFCGKQVLIGRPALEETKTGDRKE